MSAYNYFMPSFTEKMALAMPQGNQIYLVTLTYGQLTQASL